MERTKSLNIVGQKYPARNTFQEVAHPERWPPHALAWKSLNTYLASSWTKQHLRIKSIPFQYKLSPTMRYLHAWYHIRRHSMLENWASILWVWRYIINVPYQGSIVAMRNKCSSSQDSYSIVSSLLLGNLDTSFTNLKNSLL